MNKPLIWSGRVITATRSSFCSSTPRSNCCAFPGSPVVCPPRLRPAHRGGDRDAGADLCRAVIRSAHVDRRRSPVHGYSVRCGDALADRRPLFTHVLFPTYWRRCCWGVRCFATRVCAHSSFRNHKRLTKGNENMRVMSMHKATPDMEKGTLRRVKVMEGWAAHGRRGPASSWAGEGLRPARSAFACGSLQANGRLRKGHSPARTSSCPRTRREDRFDR